MTMHHTAIILLIVHVACLAWAIRYAAKAARLHRRRWLAFFIAISLVAVFFIAWEVGYLLGFVK